MFDNTESQKGAYAMKNHHFLLTEYHPLRAMDQRGNLSALSPEFPNLHFLQVHSGREMPTTTFLTRQPAQQYYAED